MKGVICAGGLGTRLRPLTLVTNKHLLPVFDQPMIFYPIQLLKAAGITNILIITGPESAGDFVKVLGDGSSMGCQFTFRFQSEPGGIAQAVGMAEDFVGKDKVVICLGDNIFSEDLSEPIRKFAASKSEAGLFLKSVPDPQRFGVAEVKGNKILSIEEKPKIPKSNLAVTGLYLYNGASLFDVIHKLKPSGRGELEITDVNNHFVKAGKAEFHQLKGDWSDAGTFESLHRASVMARNRKNGVSQ